MPDRQRLILDAVERYNASDKFFADADRPEKDLVDLFELIEFDDTSMSHSTGRRLPTHRNAGGSGWGATRRAVGRMDPDRLRLRQPCSQVRSPVTTTMHPALRPFASTSADYRGEPLLECLCGCDSFIVIARFDPETRLVGHYLLDGLCALCGALVTLPTPIDEGHEVYG